MSRRRRVVVMLDASALIHAGMRRRGGPDADAQGVMWLSTSPHVRLISTRLLELEVLPVAERRGRAAEAAFYERALRSARRVTLPGSLLGDAVSLARAVGHPGLDAAHLAVCAREGAAFVTLDLKAARLARVAGVPIRSPAAAARRIRRGRPL